MKKKYKTNNPEMEAPPTTDTVYQSVYALYNNPDTSEKEKASKWLDSLQKSVSENIFSYFCDGKLVKPRIILASKKL